MELRGKCRRRRSGRRVKRHAGQLTLHPPDDTLTAIPAHGGKLSREAQKAFLPEHDDVVPTSERTAASVSSRDAWAKSEQVARSGAHINRPEGYPTSAVIMTNRGDVHRNARGGA